MLIPNTVEIIQFLKCTKGNANAYLIPKFQKKYSIIDSIPIKNEAINKTYNNLPKANSTSINVVFNVFKLNFIT